MTVDQLEDARSSSLIFSSTTTLMAETFKGKKWVHVDGYVREDGTRVGPYDRSTPDTSKGRKPKGGRSSRS